MNKNLFRRRAVFLVLAFLAVLVGVCFCLAWRQFRQEQRNQALIAAIKQGATSRAIALLDAGADANSLDHGDNSTSFRDVLARWFERVRHTPSDAPPPRPALLVLFGELDSVFMNYREMENVPLLTALLKHGANVNAKDSDGASALERATTVDFHESVRLLLEQGADPNIKNANGETPLFYADPDSINILLKHGAQVDSRDLTNCTALLKVCRLIGSDDQHAMQEAYPRLLLLLQRGANANIRETNGMTPLVTAVTGDAPLPVIQALLDHGADPNAEAVVDWSRLDPEDGGKKQTVTPLIAAVMQQDIATVQLLLRHGAHLNARTADGLTALQAARQNGGGDSRNRNALIVLLKQAGAKE